MKSTGFCVQKTLIAADRSGIDSLPEVQKHLAMQLLGTEKKSENFLLSAQKSACFLRRNFFDFRI